MSDPTAETDVAPTAEQVALDIGIDPEPEPAARPRGVDVDAVLDRVFDELRPIGAPLVDPDPLRWDGYGVQREKARARSSTPSAVTTHVGRIGPAGRAVIIRWHFAHLGGSMGSAEGQRVCGAYDHARALKLPVIVFASSGGARMQEGMASLVQMTATVAAAQEHADAGLAQIAVCGHPTTGGVFASHVNVADVRFAAEDATIGFAGPRVAAAFTGEDLPEESHTAVGALLNGLVDAVVDTEVLAGRLEALLDWLDPEADAIRPAPITGEQREQAPSGPGEPAPEARDPWAEVQAARAEDRLRTPDHLDAIEVALELFGDGTGPDDPALRVALARIDAVAGARPERAVVVAMDPTGSNGGRITSAGYRKAWRGFDLAERLQLPVVTLVDTPGADPSADSEAAGIAQHIARTFDRMLRITVPTVSAVVGEGGSGGALALATTDRLLIQEHAIFSVIAPEGAAAILHRDTDRAPEVAAQLDPTAWRLRELGLADAVLPEPAGRESAVLWAHVQAAIANVRRSGGAGVRVERRRERWRARAHHASQQ